MTHRKSTGASARLRPAKDGPKPGVVKPSAKSSAKSSAKPSGKSSGKPFEQKKNAAKLGLKLTRITPGVLAAMLAFAEAILGSRNADEAMAALMRRKDLGNHEKAALRRICDEMIRSWARLRWHISTGGREIDPRSVALAAIALLAGLDAQRIAPILRATPGQKEPLTPREAAWIGALKTLGLDHKKMPEAVKLECPAHWLKALRESLGEQAGAELMAMRRPPHAALRVNTLKATRESILNDLEKRGSKAEAGTRSALAILVAQPSDPAVLPLIQEGRVDVQDEGSQVVALLTDARPGQQVLDLCAGAGGKSLALAAQMQNRGHLVAADTHSGRLRRAKERLKRSGVENAECRLLTGLTDKWLKSRRGRFDRVLIDAPCTGTGAWRRNPDQKWRLDEGALERLIKEQDALLDLGAALVSPGGYLIYATCSLLRQENEDRIAAFLARATNFAVRPVADHWATLNLGPWTADQGTKYLQLSPARHGCDGFFACVLARR